MKISCVAVFVAALLAGSAMAAESSSASADLVLLNGKVLTVDANDTVAEAIAIRGNRILAVGSSGDIAALAAANARRVDLKGRTVTPGLIDTHAHLTSGATREMYEVNLSFPNARSIADVVRLVKDRRDIGTIEPGKYADLAVWDKDLYSVPAGELKDMKCSMTVFNGKVVRE